MDPITVVIDGKEYEYVDSTTYEGKTYVALSDGESITISEYIMVKGKMVLTPIDDAMVEKLKLEMELS